MKDRMAKPWYKIEDEMDSHYIYYVPASHLRHVSRLRVSPHFPRCARRPETYWGFDCPTKLWPAYESNEIVMGNNHFPPAYRAKSIPGLISTDTPKGWWFPYLLKNAFQNIWGNGIFIAEKNDSKWFCLFTITKFPVCPWDYFLWTLHWCGLSMGTYWHTNFGTPMSHGCVNMRTDEAKWIFRWDHTGLGIRLSGEERGYGDTCHRHLTPIRLYNSLPTR